MFIQFTPNLLQWSKHKTEADILWVICGWYFADNDENDSWQKTYTFSGNNSFHWKYWQQHTAKEPGSLKRPGRRKPQGAQLKFMFIWLHHISRGFSDCVSLWDLNLLCFYISCFAPVGQNAWGPCLYEDVSYNTWQLYLKLKLNVNPLRDFKEIFCGSV